MQQNKILGLLLFSLLISSAFLAVQPAYAIQATGGTITYSGIYKIHTFTTSGTFTVTSGSGDVDYLVVAGGGGATTTYGSGGGGGAGGFRAGTLAVTPQAYTITVGAGGASGAGVGGDGGNSVFSTITSTGGGGGGAPSGGAGRAGGSGGGTGDGGGAGGAGTGGQGNNGGAGGAGGGGGGGASAVGSTGATGNGGAGTASSISGASVTYAGGGGGAIAGGSTGGAGGGGNGGGAGIASTSGTANSGGGAGAAGSIAGGNTGGSGIVIIRYINVLPPDAVTDLTSTSTTSNSVALDWTAPSAGGGGQYITGYQINKTSPWGLPLVLVNDTGNTNTDYTATGLTFGTQYSFRVSAWTNNTGGHPFNNATGNILNVTTTSTTYSGVAPTNLVASSDSATQIDLQWTASTMQNKNGYRIQREDPIGSGWDTIVSNTTNTNIYYNNTGLTSNLIYNYRVLAMNGSGISSPSNEYDMTTFHKPNAVNDLTGSATSLSVIVLTWTVPISYAPEITGYQVNYTTPEGNPQTIFSSTPTTPTATITGLGVGLPYSFRVSPITVHGMNATGNIFNATTTTTYVLGDLPSPDITNLDDFSIFYNRTQYNATRIYLDVTYPNSYDLDCNFLFKFSRANQTYSSLAGTPITGPGSDTDNERYRFTIDGANDEIINVRCWDDATDDEAKYIITITDFELLNQIDNLHNGTYGTMGQIGGLDIVVLIVVIIGMIGFNRVTPIAGVIFTIITVGALSVLGIIQTYQIIFPFLALVVLWAYTRTRQE